MPPENIMPNSSIKLQALGQLGWGPGNCFKEIKDNFLTFIGSLFVTVQSRNAGLEAL